MNIPTNQLYYPEIFRIVAGNLTGSGFLMQPTEMFGHVGMGITNAHVLGNSPSARIFPIYTDNKSFDVEVIAICHEFDIAFFRIPDRHQATMVKHLNDKYNLQELPALKFADVSQLKLGDNATSVGHPMGLFHQVIGKHKLVAYEDFDAHPILYVDGAVNPGNSGGPLLSENREVIGIVSLKITAPHVNNLNGIRTSDEPKYLLSRVNDIMNARANQAMLLSQMLQAQLGARAALVAKAAGALDDAFDVAFQEHAVGGKVRGTARPFHIWCKRHVLDDDNDDFLEGGAQLLAYVVDKVRAGEHKEIMKKRVAAGGWIEMREEMAGAPLPMAFAGPTLAAELRLPIFGPRTHPLHTMGEVVHYGHDPSQITGGVLVSDVLPRSLYEKAGGRVGDIIHKVVCNDVEYTLNMQGRSEPVNMGMTLTLDNLLIGFPYESEVAFHVLRDNAEATTLHMAITAPAQEDLPHVRNMYANTASGMRDAQEMIQVAGVTIGALRGQHAMEFQMASLMSPQEQYRFHAMIYDVAIESPAHGLLSKGMRLVDVDGAPLKGNLTELVQQLQAAAQKPVFRISARREFEPPVRFSFINARPATPPQGAPAH